MLTYPITDNLTLNTYDEPPFATRGLRNDKPIMEFARKMVKKFDIRAPRVQTLVRNLSGGNQQKTILARELSRQIRLLIASQPTRGLDVGSIEFIHKPDRGPARRGRGGAARLRRTGRGAGPVRHDRRASTKANWSPSCRAAETTREKLGLLMTGGTSAEQPQNPAP